MIGFILFAVIMLFMLVAFSVIIMFIYNMFIEGDWPYAIPLIALDLCLLGLMAVVIIKAFGIE